MSDNPAQHSPERGFKMKIERDVYVTMRDGVRIAVCIYRPDTDAPVPSLFAASPYQYRYDSAPAYTIFAQRETGPIEWYVAQGYAFVHADVRGSGQSEGEFSWYGPQETADYYELIEWIGTRPWCNGKVGGTGQSYYAVAQWWMGIVNPPHLACIVPYDGRVDHYRDAGYHGGIMGGFQSTWYNQVRFLNRHRPAGQPGREMRFDLAYHVLEHQTYDDWWKLRNPFERLCEIKVPVLSIGHWPKLGLHLRGNIVGYEEIKSPKKLLISEARTPPDVHHLCDDPAFHQREVLAFYDHHLKGIDNGVMEKPALRIYVRGADTFREYDAWPKPARFASWYLRKGPSGSVTSLNDGGLSPEAPAANEGETVYRYPDAAWRNGVVAFTQGAADPVKKVLTFTSAPLDKDLEIIGGIVLELCASSDQIDTDFVVKLSDQAPQSPAERARDGAQPAFLNVSKGWLKASHHHTKDAARSRPDRPFYRHDDPQPITPGAIYTFEIEIVTCAYRFKAGHRIRLEIANGDSPVTDGVWTHPYHQYKVGADTIFHNAAHPSRLILPVADDGTAGGENSRPARRKPAPRPLF